jgi:hypothetical protein
MVVSMSNGRTRNPLWLRIISAAAWATVAVQVGLVAIVAAGFLGVIAAVFWNR